MTNKKNDELSCDAEKFETALKKASLIPKNKKKSTSTEVDAYEYISRELNLLGWIVKNPSRNSDGEVYKQNECLSHKFIKKCWNLERPEATVIFHNDIGEVLWIIEAKRDRKQIDLAVKEAKEYAEKINNHSDAPKALFISGLAGNNDDGFTVENQFLRNDIWETILFNGKRKDTLLSKVQINWILSTNDSQYKDLPDLPIEKYLSAAETINETLHEYSINKNKRARFIAGLILSIASDSKLDINESDALVLVANINTLIAKRLNEAQKNHFLGFINLELPPSNENHTKYKDAIKKTYKELQTLDIKNSMNSGNDILGKFYEMFLKYGNGAKEIGIVLTPRHIANFATDILDISYSDYVLDPTCGTGGFLVAALDYVKKKSNTQQIDRFKKYHLFGIEQDDEVIALALVNMIFRGDGRHKMKEGNCFYVSIDKMSEKEEGYNTAQCNKMIDKVKNNPDPIITKVLMNPPFALKKGEEKESHFIDYALSQMLDGGMLFAIIPISVLVESSGKHWRKRLLNHNTLLASITLPEDLFYPVSVGTVGVFIKKGIPHNYKSKVYFARCIYDGFKKKKGKRLEDKKAKNLFENIKDELKSFVQCEISSNIQDIPEFKKVTALDEQDKNIDLSPENYIDSKIPSIEEIQLGVDELIRENIAFNIRFSHKLNERNFV